MPPAKTRKPAARKPATKAKKPKAKSKPAAKTTPKKVAKTPEAPKFGTPEWREKYAKTKRKSK